MHTKLLTPRRRLHSAAALLIAVAASVSTLAAASPAVAAPSGPGSVIEIVNEHSNLCLDDLGYKTDPGAEVAQWGCNGGAVQIWEITDVGNGYSQIKNRHSNLCLDNFNFGTTPGAEVRQWTCNGNTAQRWRISDVGGGFTEIRNQHSNLCLDNKDWKQNFGAAVHQWTCSGAAVQRWELWDTTIPRVTYAIDRAENPTTDQADAYARIDAAVSAAVDRYNALTDINKRLTVWYRPGVPTAEAGLDGGMSFGSDRHYMSEGTALHEMGHTLGVGTSGGYYDKCVNGAWTGTIANNLLQSWDGQGARLNCSNPHIWPYGLNYSSEFSETSFTRNVELTEAMIADGM